MNEFIGCDKTEKNGRIATALSLPNFYNSTLFSLVVKVGPPTKFSPAK